MYSRLSLRPLRLVAVSAVGVLTAAALAAGAGAGPVSFGRHFHGQHYSGGNWGGYVSFGSFTTATASWTEPSVTCNSSNDLFAPWVGIDGDGSSTVEQTGVATDCSSGSPEYQAWYEMYPAAPVYYSSSEAPVQAGDHLTATVTRSGSSYRLDLTDTTQGWTKTTTQSLNAQHSSAEAIIESPTDSYPSINGGVSFDGVTFDGRNLADTGPQGLDADDNGSATFSPGPIGSDGQSFTMARH
ncbi:G1 family glutamic endopeptidase [Amycolatopsis jejuensis]|uniref:G1 family glutamic endopeptidase n=1 Tax=Amycolatopsis jejuensis TaxID=330084 RepID=UPI0005249E5E|nr:G1 family glutamic endopeptidase [Amycolatopsis jejuensis]